MDNNINNQVQSAPVYNSELYNSVKAEMEDKKKENYILGILGALLFSLGGVAVYFGLYQLNFIAGISGFLMFFLARLGYGIFTKTNKESSLVGTISAVLIMLVMIYVAEYISMAFVGYTEIKDYGYTFFDTVKLMPEFLKDSEVKSAFTGDLVFCYIFGILGVVGDVVSFFKRRKQAKASPAPAPANANYDAATYAQNATYGSAPVTPDTVAPKAEAPTRTDE